MSLESSIAALTAQGGLLMDLPQQIATAAQVQITAIGNAYNSRINGLQTIFYVDQINGDDAAAGSLAAPLKTLGRALALTPRGGRCEVRLQSDYTIAAPVTVDGRNLVLMSDSGVKRNLYFERLSNVAVTPNLRYPAGFVMRGGGAHVTIYGLTINVPLLETGWSGLTPSRVGLFTNYALTGWEIAEVNISSCNINIPADPFCRFLPVTMLTVLMWYGNVLTGAKTSPLGWISDEQTNTAGAATASMPWIVTNLINI